MELIKRHKFLVILSSVVLLAVVFLVGLYLIFGNKNGKWITGGKDTLANYRVRTLSDGRIEININTANLEGKELVYADSDVTGYSIKDAGVKNKWHKYYITVENSHYMSFQLDVYEKEEYDSLMKLEEGKEGIYNLPEKCYTFYLNVSCSLDGEVSIQDIGCQDVDGKNSQKSITAHNCTISYHGEGITATDYIKITVQGSEKDKFFVETDKNVYVQYNRKEDCVEAYIKVGAYGDTEEIIGTYDIPEYMTSHGIAYDENYDVPEKFTSEISLVYTGAGKDETVLKLKAECSSIFFEKISEN